ncbi:MAG: hypothetical protein MUO23_14660 [Anaerolineales bacterium]|nr:hypothetical protein [Anaerolineales bacterium]
MLISLASLLLVVSGPGRQAEAMNTADILPPEFQYYSPDQQAQLQQALASSASPNFVDVFPVAAILDAASLQHL